MEPEHQALIEPDLWILAAPSPGAIIAQHPNGVVLRITQSRTHSLRWWLVSTPRIDPAVHKTAHKRLMSFEHRSPLRGLLGVIADLRRVSSPESTARLDQLLLEIQVWALDHRHRGHVVVLDRGNPRAMFRTGHSSVELPEPLAARWQDLRDVRSWNAQDRHFDGTLPVVIVLPTTAHEAMALRAQLHASRASSL